MNFKWKISALTGCAIFAASCGNSELPVESRQGIRKANGNSELRLPSNRGGMPDQRSRWWDGGETTYPNPGYYSSERR